MAERRAEATWQGALRDGQGRMRADSGAFAGPYSFATRFGDEAGTNPEELLGAAHASCYAMALAAVVEKRGRTAKRIHTRARVRIVPAAEGFRITRIELETEGEVPGMSEEDFFTAADEAFASCPLSQALRGGSAELEHRTTLLASGRAAASGEEARPS